MLGAVSDRMGYSTVRSISPAIFLFFLLFLSISGCGSDSGGHSHSIDTFPNYGLEGDDIVRIEISSPDSSNPWSGGSSAEGDTSSYQKTMTLDVGTTADLSVDAYDINGTIYKDIDKVTWKSDNEKVVMVDSSGKVTPLSEGTATITAIMKMPDGTMLTDTVTITVLPSPVAGKTWKESNRSLPQPMWDHASAIWNGYIYVAGGNSGCSGQYEDCGFTIKVFYAPINQDGSIGSFNQTTPLPKSLRGHTLTAYNGYLYVIGGIVQPQFGEPPYPDPTNFKTILNDKVYYSKINPDGSIGDWLETTPLYLPELPPEQQDKAGLFAHAAVAHDGYIYVSGGWNVALNKNVRTLLIGPINDDGTIQKWIHNENSDLPYDLSKHAMVVATVNGESFLYIIGGNSGALGSTGGTQTFHREIYYAKIDRDGIPQKWMPASSNLPVSLIDHAAVALDRYIFVIGGRNGDDSWTNYKAYPNVYDYFIVDNGDLIQLNRISPLPEPLFHHAAVADKNSATGKIDIYVTGGAGGDTEDQGKRKDTVYYLSD